MWNPLEMGDGRPQQKVYCRAGSETGDGSGGAKGEVKICRQPSCFLRVARWS